MHTIPLPTPALLPRRAAAWMATAACAQLADAGIPARRIELGFWSAYPESAFWMGVEPKFQRIAHSASSVTITFRMEGSGESLDNESWGIDQLRVIVGND